MPHQTPISPNPLKFRDKGAASNLRTNSFMFQYRNSPVQKRTGSAAASLIATISSGRKMVKAEVLENQNENRRTDELQETLVELEVQAANRRIESVDRRKCRAPGVRPEAEEHSSSAMPDQPNRKRGGSAASTPAFIRIRASQAKDFSCRDSSVLARFRQTSHASLACMGCGLEFGDCR